MKKLLIFGLLISQMTIAQKKATVPATYFPPKGIWEEKSPTAMGMDEAKLKEAIAFAIAHENAMPKNQELAQIYNFYKEPFSDALGPFADRNATSGVVIYKGYMVGSWGDVHFTEQTNSVTKSFVSTAVGIAVDKGLIRSIHDKVVDYVPIIEPYDPNPYRGGDEIGRPQFLRPFESEHNRKITWDHMLRQTSDWEGVLWGKPDWADRPNDKPLEWINRKHNEPGSVYKYNDTRVNALALAATAVWHQPLPEIIREKIMEPIGASNQWHWTGYRNSWIVMDGKLMQSVSGGGHFGGGLFIRAMDMARFGWLTYNKGKWNDQQLISEKWIDLSTTPTPANPGYGFMNFFLNTSKKEFPSAPESAYAHIGNGTNMIYVDRENELVIVARWIDNKHVNELIGKFLSSLK
ncbi:MAG: beta-lactamase family protein [Chitinophagaceae bacterium]|nr:beta-lactamase family protein [Chitinophagaceae bacterium]